MYDAECVLHVCVERCMTYVDSSDTDGNGRSQATNIPPNEDGHASRGSHCIISDCVSPLFR